MPPRRFSDDEAAEIFRRAAELETRDPQALVAREGMTLVELQEIGRQAGLDPALVVRAATLAAATTDSGTRRLLGIPVGVRHTVELGRPLTDSEWERLVVDLRETFDARGVMRVDGAFRQWSNGNLQVLVEPVAGGHRIRFRTTNAQARGLMAAGATMAVVGAVNGIADAAMMGHSFGVVAASMGVIVAMGASLFAIGAGRLPGWARRRRSQMEAIGQRIST